MCVHIRSVAFRAKILTKLTNTQQNNIQLSYTFSCSNRTKNVEKWEGNLLAFISGHPVVFDNYN